jgi:hypothetical protein
MKYRKKPIVIDAWKWGGVWNAEMKALVLISDYKIVPVKDGNRVAWISISTLEGDMRADPGDWIIRGIKGEFYPCKPDIFEATYEPVNP